MKVYEDIEGIVKVSGTPVGVLSSCDEDVEAVEYVIKDVSAIPSRVLYGEEMFIPASEEAFIIPVSEVDRVKYRISKIESSLDSMRKEF